MRNDPAKDREYCRNYRAENPDIVSAIADRYRRSHLEEKREYLRTWNAKDRRRACAHQQVYQAVKKGHLVRPESCEGCGKVCKPHACHLDYDRRLFVVWFCPACHKHMDTNILKVA